jgi:hypothetical protein
MNFECFFCIYFLYINIKIRRFFEKTIDDFLAYFKREKLEATQNWYETVSKTLVRAEQEGDYQLYFTKSATAGDFTLNKSFISKYKSQLKNPKIPILIFIRTLSLFYGSYGYIKIQTRPIGWKI